MRILVDGQTFGTPEINRGIGRVVTAILARIAHHPGLRTTLALPSPAAADAVPAAIRDQVACDVLGEGTAWDEGFAEMQIGRPFAAVWHPNPLMPNVRPPVLRPGPRHWATLYDLIPLVMRDVYLDRWPDVVRADYLARLERLAADATGCAFISESARADFRAAFPQARAELTVVPIAVDHTRFWPWVLPGPTRGAERYMLYTGGIDPRKNVPFAIEAFARLRARPDIDPSLRLKIVCSVRPEDRDDLFARAGRLGVADHLDVPGYVPDAELARLYRNAACFVFPSRYEGFGLPVLEALASGVPVACARNSSLPEVAGPHAVWFDADDPVGAADAMRAALARREAADWPEARAAAVRHARTYSWARTGQDMAAALLGTSARGRQRIGLVTPWPPQRSGIADYSADLVRALSRHADVTVFLDGRSPPDDPLPIEGVRILPLSALEAARPDLDRVVHTLGNNVDFHIGAWRLAWDRPDAAIIHDVDLDTFARTAFETTDSRYLREPMAAFERLLAHDRDSTDRQPGLLPFVAALAERGRISFVHSRWQARRFPDRCRVDVIPSGTADPGPDRAQAGLDRLRALGIDPSREFVVGSFGFPTRFKRIPSVLRAVADLRRRGYPVRLLNGGAHPDPADGLDALIGELGLTESVTVTGFLDDEAFGDLLAAVDVVVSFRYPSMGETSAVVMRALASGRPLITSRHQQFAEFPDDVCWKVDPHGNEVGQLSEMIATLIEDPHLRAQMGENARDWAARNTGWDLVAHLLLDALAREGTAS